MLAVNSIKIQVSDNQKKQSAYPFKYELFLVTTLESDLYVVVAGCQMERIHDKLKWCI